MAEIWETDAPPRGKLIRAIVRDQHGTYQPSNPCICVSGIWYTRGINGDAKMEPQPSQVIRWQHLEGEGL